ncbi:MAG: tetratricopeptide repeat protein [Myxococcota bacterium]
MRRLTEACLGLGLGWFGVLPSAEASSIESRLEVFDREAVAIARVVDNLRGQVGPTSPLSPEEVSARFDEAVFLQMVGDSERAAESLYTLLSTNAFADAGMRRDAEWTYAESLLAMGNLHAAAERFEAVVRDRKHPFYADAVRKLLEVYAAVRDRSAFLAVYEREIASGRVKPTGQVLYALAKGHYQQGDLSAAQQAFASLPDSDPFASRSQYFLGVIATQQGELERAIEVFQGVVARKVRTEVDGQVKDRALLALGRLHYHSGDFAKASQRYAEVSTDGELLDDKLYETIWASIRQERWMEAIHNVEVFLMAFPNHEYAAQLLLLRGHLHVQDQNWDSALTSYERVIREYRPVHDRFQALSEPGSDTNAEVREVIEDLRGASGLPDYAVSMMREDPLLARAVEVFEDLDQQRKALDASDRLIKDLQVFLNAQGLGSFTSLRAQAMYQRGQILEQRLGLAELQIAWLTDQPGMAPERILALAERRQQLLSDLERPQATVEAARASLNRYEKEVGRRRSEAARVRERVDAMSDELSTVTTRLALQSDGGEAIDPVLVNRAQQLKSSIAAERVDLAALETAIVNTPVPHDIDRVPYSLFDVHEGAVGRLTQQLVAEWPADEAAQILLARIETTDEVLETGYADLGKVLRLIGEAADGELGRLQSQFDAEVSAVGAQRAAYSGTLDAARSVSSRLTRSGFGRLEDFFASSMEKADMGIVDVHWARKLKQSDAIGQTKAEQEVRTGELERRFELIRSKLGDSP